MRVLDHGMLERSQQSVERRWRYGLLVEDIEVDGFHCESYGVAVTDSLTGESARCRHVTVSAMDALALLNTLAHGTVTPVSLAEVVEDWLGR